MTHKITVKWKGKCFAAEFKNGLPRSQLLTFSLDKDEQLVVLKRQGSPSILQVNGSAEVHQSQAENEPVPELLNALPVKWLL
jgi:hypothetical protein